MEFGRAKLRKILESSAEISPKDQSEKAKARRRVPNGELRNLSGMTFWARVRVDPGQNGFRPKNSIDYVLTPASVEWPERPIAKQSRSVVPLADEMSDEIPY